MTSRSASMPKVSPRHRVVVGISGASGAIYGVRLLQLLADRPDVESHLIVSRAGAMTINAETDSRRWPMWFTPRAMWGQRLPRVRFEPRA